MINVTPILGKGTSIVISTGIVIGSITAILGGYAWYLNNIWTPHVEIIAVDFSKGIASVKVGRKIIEIYGDATFTVSNVGDWGIKFGSSKYIDVYDRLELVKRGMVVQYLKRNGMS